MEELEIIDVSDNPKVRDKFMLGIYISLLVLIVLGSLVYFFGYEILKPFIEV